MLLTELILSKDNVLSQVWIAAHYERKLSKQQALKISVQDSVREYRIKSYAESGTDHRPIADRGYSQGKCRAYSSKDVWAADVGCRSNLFEKDAVPFR